MSTPARTERRPALVTRLFVVLLGATAVWAVMAWLNSAVLTGGPTVAVRAVNAVLVCVPALVLVALARRLLDRRPWEGLGLQPVRRAARPFLVGVAAFLVPSALAGTVALLVGWAQLEAQVPVARLLASVVLLVPLVLVFEALPEELVFRGYLQRNLSTAMAPWVAVVAQAALFAVFGTALWVANEGWDVLGERAVMFLGCGVVLGLLRIQTGGLWTPIGFHVAFQVVAQTVLGDRVDTGAGPGALVAIVVVPFALATTLTALLHRRDVNWSVPEPE